MNTHFSIAFWTRAAILLLLLTAICSPAWGQSCSLCYTQAASAGSRMIQALRSGILVLIFPPMVICIGLTILTYRKKDRFHERNTRRDQSDLGW
jgi:hypothetical protein